VIVRESNAMLLSYQVSSLNPKLFMTEDWPCWASFCLPIWFQVDARTKDLAGSSLWRVHRATALLD